MPEILTEPGEGSYRDRMKDTRRSDGRCPASIHHGPGHQSRTFCELPADGHEIHEAVYGEFGQSARWRGDEVFSGFFDEPPRDPDDN